jgi:hypothetical protein
MATTLGQRLLYKDEDVPGTPVLKERMCLV